MIDLVSKTTTLLHGQLLCIGLRWKSSVEDKLFQSLRKKSLTRFVTLANKECMISFLLLNSSSWNHMVRCISPQDGHRLHSSQWFIMDKEQSNTCFGVQGRCHHIISFSCFFAMKINNKVAPPMGQLPPSISLYGKCGQPRYNVDPIFDQVNLIKWS